jgi:hypothetical protein
VIIVFEKAMELGQIPLPSSVCSKSTPIILDLETFEGGGERREGREKREKREEREERREGREKSIVHLSVEVTSPPSDQRTLAVREFDKC